MNYSSALEVFKAQTKNVQVLDQAIKHITRAINHALRVGDKTSAAVHTKILALVFSAWAEARFSKLIHTPYGFTPDEILQIKTAHQKNGLEKGWEKCLELALKKVPASQQSSEIPNKRKKLLEIIKEYIIDLSLLRNKIAHGQWEIALNRDNDAENSLVTDKLDKLDVIAITVWHQAYKYLEPV